MKDLINKIKNKISQSFKKDTSFRKDSVYRKKNLSKAWKLMLVNGAVFLVIVVVVDTILFFRFINEEISFTEEELASGVVDSDSEDLAKLVDRFNKKREIFESVAGISMEEIEEEFVTEQNGEVTQEEVAPQLPGSVTEEVIEVQ